MQGVRATYIYIGRICTYICLPDARKQAWNVQIGLHQLTNKLQGSQNAADRLITLITELPVIPPVTLYSITGWTWCVLQSPDTQQINSQSLQIMNRRSSANSLLWNMNLFHN